MFSKVSNKYRITKPTIINEIAKEYQDKIYELLGYTLVIECSCEGMSEERQWQVMNAVRFLVVSNDFYKLKITPVLKKVGFSFYAIKDFHRFVVSKTALAIKKEEGYYAYISSSENFIKNLFLNIPTCLNWVENWYYTEIISAEDNVTDKEGQFKKTTKNLVPLAKIWTYEFTKELDGHIKKIKRGISQRELGLFLEKYCKKNNIDIDAKQLLDKLNFITRENPDEIIDPYTIYEQFDFLKNEGTFRKKLQKDFTEDYGEAIIQAASAIPKTEQEWIAWDRLSKGSTPPDPRLENSIKHNIMYYDLTEKYPGVDNNNDGQITFQEIANFNKQNWGKKFIDLDEFDD